MNQFSTIPLTEQPDPVLRSGRLGFLCNQAAWRPGRGEYFFETLYKRGNLKRLFLPEHGLFGELQDQVKLDTTDAYSRLGMADCEFVSLYGTGEASRAPQPEQLSDLDALVIELQDVGVRYYTFLTTLYYLFKVLVRKRIPLPVWILDRENPAGRAVEGSPLQPGYGSFIGIEGVPHRYGLTLGEMATLFYDELGADFPLTVISYKAEAGGASLAPWVIPPSPNFAGSLTAHVYSGQCRWEGTNVSEGRGTTRPFELFGAPWMETLLDYNRREGYGSWNEPGHPLFQRGVFLRWHRFIPTFHKYQGECCFGFQLIPNPGEPYHALAHALAIIRFVAENCEGFAWRPGTYEAGNDKTAIELLAGDPLLLDYLKGGGDWADIAAYLKETEARWIQRTERYLFYGETLISV